jgi:hypothetical protein
MTTCQRHQLSIPGFSHEQLAEAIGDLRYDSLAALLAALAEKLERDAQADAGRQRHKLSSSLAEAAIKLTEAKSAVDRAWAISKPYMTP